MIDDDRQLQPLQYEPWWWNRFKEIWSPDNQAPNSWIKNHYGDKSDKNRKEESPEEEAD